MLIITDLAHFSSCYPVMAIGVFDGVHQAHRIILQQLVDRAREQGGAAVILTFFPHPQKVISSGDAPTLLQTDVQKQQILEQLGLDVMVRLPFTRRLSLLTPDEFTRQILHDHGIREIHVGSNFRFGHRRVGDLVTLRSLGREMDFEVHEVKPVYFRDHRVSSTYVRQVLSEGRVSLASRLLKRPYQVEGIVVRGSRRGMEMGFPTANLDVENELIPATGVYFTQALINGERLPGVTNIGYRPTLHADLPLETPTVETHLLDFKGSLYGKSMKLEFLMRLRAEKKFDGIAALSSRIERDVRLRRDYLTRAGRIKEKGNVLDYKGS